MRPRMLIVAMGTVGALVVGVAGAVLLREWNRIGEELRRNTGAIAHELAGDLALGLHDVEETLAFATGLADRGAEAEPDADSGLAPNPVPDPAEDLRIRHELEALIVAVTHFREIVLYRGVMAPSLAVYEPGLGGASLQPMQAILASTAARAAAGVGPRVIVSEPISAGETTYFAFARATRSGAVALLVERAYLFDAFRVLTRSADREVVVLEPDNGRAELGAGQVFQAPSTWFQAEEPRLVELDPGLAATLSLPRRAAVLALQSSPRRHGRAWIVGVASSERIVDGARAEELVRVAVGVVLALSAVLAIGRYLAGFERREADLRDRLRVASELAHLAEKTEKVVESIPEAVVVLSADARVSSINRALRDRLHAVGSPPPLPGGPLAAALPAASPELLARLQATIGAAQEGRAPRALLAERCALFAEREGQYNLHVVPFERPLPDAALLLVIEDLSSLHDLESQLVRAEKLATVGVLAAGIAHEVGTPLGIIRGRAQHLLRKVGDEDRSAPGLRVIVEQIDRVTRIIRQLLDFARRKPVVETRAVPLSPLVETIRELLGHRFTEQGVALEVALPPDLPALAADADQLQQVLLNLLLNACDACPVGGGVRLSAAYDPHELGGLRIEVRDTGEGIPDGLQRTVFDPFFTTKQRGEGTGLGLTIAADLVKAHGGAIHLDSAVGRGTTIHVRWPIAAAPPREISHA